jgi:hypothetical protein
VTIPGWSNFRAAEANAGPLGSSPMLGEFIIGYYISDRDT